MTFRESLENLKYNVGNRNGMLLGVAIRGLGEGLEPDAVAEAFASADTGEPPLTEQEVTRAIARAKAYIVGEKSTTSAVFRSRLHKIEKEREATSADERDFVPRMIRAGRRHDNVFKRMLELSNYGVTPELRKRHHSIEFRQAQAVAFVKALYDDDSGYVYATPSVRFPRSRDRIYRASELIAQLEARPMTPTWDAAGNMSLKPQPVAFQNGIIHYSPIEYFEGRDPSKGFFVCPTHISTNYYSGDAVNINGKDSYANKKTLIRRCNALVEFDLLPVEEQVAFWVGVIETGSLDVRTIVHTGNKSLHGIIRVKDATSCDSLFGEVSTLAQEQQWERSVRSLWRLCCSNDDMRYRCDAACKDATRMTRFPGGIRDGIMQQLMVYCKECA